MLKWLRNSLNKDYLLASALDLVNQEELTATSLKEKSSSSTQRKSTKERNDLMNSVIYPSFILNTFFINYILLINLLLCDFVFLWLSPTLSLVSSESPGQATLLFLPQLLIALVCSNTPGLTCA